MHSYLRAIGFSQIKSRKDMDNIIGNILTNPTEKFVTKVSDNAVIAEISKDFSERMGITIRGEYDEKGFFHIDHYFPHFRGQGISSEQDMTINKKIDTEAYTGMCDDMRIGVSLIFYVQNVVDYIDLKVSNMKTGSVMPVTLSGLSLEGKILLPLSKDDRQIRNRNAEIKQRNSLIAAAKKGDQDAIDSLTIDDIDLYAIISRRIRTEDIYSIVDSTFIPFGSEADNYGIIGDITDCRLLINEFTKEEVYDLSLNCNDMTFNVCINKLDLVGEPEIGRRFKGNIWMQGFINFSLST